MHDLTLGMICLDPYKTYMSLDSYLGHVAIFVEKKMSGQNIFISRKQTENTSLPPMPWYILLFLYILCLAHEAMGIFYTIY